MYQTELVSLRWSHDGAGVINHQKCNLQLLNQLLNILTTNRYPEWLTSRQCKNKIIILQNKKNFPKNISKIFQALKLVLKTASFGVVWMSVTNLFQKFGRSNCKSVSTLKFVRWLCYHVIFFKLTENWCSDATCSKDFDWQAERQIWI